MAHSGISVLFEGTNFSRLMGGLWTSVAWDLIRIITHSPSSDYPLYPPSLPGVFPDCSNSCSFVPGLLYFATTI